MQDSKVCFGTESQNKVFLVEKPGFKSASQSAFPVKLPPLALPLIPAAASSAIVLARWVLRVVIYIFCTSPNGLAILKEGYVQSCGV